MFHLSVELQSTEGYLVVNVCLKPTYSKLKSKSITSIVRFSSFNNPILKYRQNSLAKIIHLTHTMY